jgi:hypothetical protein
MSVILLIRLFMSQKANNVVRPHKVQVKHNTVMDTQSVPEIQSNPVEYEHCSITQMHQKLQLRFTSSSTTRTAGNKGGKATEEGSFVTRILQ